MFAGITVMCNNMLTLHLSSPVSAPIRPGILSITATVPAVSAAPGRAPAVTGASAGSPVRALSHLGLVTILGTSSIL